MSFYLYDLFRFLLSYTSVIFDLNEVLQAVQVLHPK